MRKRYLALILGMVSLPAFADEPVSPNLYECKGLSLLPQPRKIQVSYSASSFGGEPLMTIQLGDETISGFGDEIRTEQTLIGTLVSVYDKNFVSFASRILTLVVPDVILGDQESVKLRTRLFNTLHDVEIPSGAVQQSVSWHVRCTASSVVF